VRRSGAAPGSRPPDLGDDQRLTRLRRLVGHRAEAIGLAYPLQVQQKDIGAALVEPPIDIVVRLEDGLVAGADLMREMQLPVAAAAEKREGQRPALATDRDRPRLAGRRE
jgi:hypothetical protein